MFVSEFLVSHSRFRLAFLFLAGRHPFTARMSKSASASGSTAPAEPDSRTLRLHLAHQYVEEGDRACCSDADAADDDHKADSKDRQTETDTTTLLPGIPRQSHDRHLCISFLSLSLSLSLALSLLLSLFSLSVSSSSI